MEVSVEWILGIFAILGAVISTLAGIIENLQDDVDRLSQGCGLAQCIWKELG